MRGKPLWYVLDEDHNPVPTNHAVEAAYFLEFGDRHVAKDTVNGADVSTVFLTIDHNWGPGSTPILFETMIFGGEHDGFCDRYATWAQAEAGHRRVVEALQNGTDPYVG